ncbi:MAG: ATP-binding protein, partial [Desulfobulbaceae bacterium]|nr:ATP-binding protein [Desulfobulbaceae bacterium]
RLTKEGETLDVWLTVTPLRDSKGKLREIATTERDITDRKQIEASLKIRTETIKFFSYSVLHDLKSPTITINGLTQRLLRNLSEISREKIEKYCSQILRTSEQLTRLVEQLNIFITEKETPHTIEHVSVAELMQIIRDEFFPQLNLRGVQINEQDNIPTICGDRISLLRSFRNLVDNALKYGGKKLSEIEIGYKETEQFHIFFVRDNGVGLIGKKPENLFDPFKREKSAAGTYGSGLGLAIVKEIAKQHGGKAWLEENQENGITFYFSVAKSLPVAPLETP